MAAFEEEFKELLGELDTLKEGSFNGEAFFDSVEVIVSWNFHQDIIPSVCASICMLDTQ